MRATVRLAVARIARPHGAQDEHQSQRRRLRSHQAAHGRRRRREQKELVNISHTPAIHLLLFIAIAQLDSTRLD